MIIKITSDDSKGVWHLVAKERDDDSAPLVYTAYGRNRAQIEFLVRGILADHAATNRTSEKARVWPPGCGGSHPHYCVSCSDRESQGPGCGNCRETGFDQTPYPQCEECRS